FNVAESVNFATSDWLAYGLKCANRYRLFGRRQAFPHFELVCKMVNKCDKLDKDTIEWLWDNFIYMYNEHYDFLKTMLQANITRGRPWDFDPSDYAAHQEDIEELEKQQYQSDGTGRMRYSEAQDLSIEDVECVVCNHGLYCAIVRCQCKPSAVTCHLHYKDICTCQMSNKWFEYRYNLTWFEETKIKLASIANATYDESSGRYLAGRSKENYEILTKSSDDIVITTISANPMLLQSEFTNRYGKILANYTTQLVAKVSLCVVVVFFFFVT
ncbi:hypothetical protein RFI_14473, partial [Reticulomyxa filosa]